MNKRNTHSPEFKTMVVLEVLREELTLSEIAKKYDIHPAMITRWKQEFLDYSGGAFKRGKSAAEKELTQERERSQDLQRLVGQLTYEVDWLKKNLLSSASKSQRSAMIDHNDKTLSIKRQAELLEINRTGIYRKEPEYSENDYNIDLMNRIDRIYTDAPTYGYRIITELLRKEGLFMNRKRVRRLMRKMGIRAIYPGPNLSKRLHARYRMPYLLRGLNIDRPDQVWGIDITYVRMGKGFMYLFVIIDWFSRCIVDYELSNSLEKSFVIECLKRALSKRKPEIINSDQGCHFTNPEYIKLLKDHDVKISMDGKGRATDNARTERFFRTLKYDCIYINEFETPRELRKGVDKYIEKYNCRRPCQVIDYQFPSDLYHNFSLKQAA